MACAGARINRNQRDRHYLRDFFAAFAFLAPALARAAGLDFAAGLAGRLAAEAAFLLVPRGALPFNGLGPDSIAACAAASLAIGTRYGEQLT